MKPFIFVIITIILLGTVSLSAQQRLPGAGSSSNSNPNERPINFSKEFQLKKDIDEVGLSVANRLMSCCSSLGGNNVYAKVNYAAVRLNIITGTFTIPMEVGWYGSFSGTYYWIRGKLIVNNQGRKQWIKIRDSGGFTPGCATDCIE